MGVQIATKWLQRAKTRWLGRATLVTLWGNMFFLVMVSVSPSPDSQSIPQLQRSPRKSLGLRRLGAWAVEMGLLGITTFVPWAVGQAVNERYTGRPVRLNGILAIAEDSTAKALATPQQSRTLTVAPLTNLLWSIGLVGPLTLGATQFYLLAVRGQTSPKRWFGVRLSQVDGRPPGSLRVLLREGVGRWGVPGAIAFGIWRYGGAFPDVGLLAGLTALTLVVEGGTALLNRRGRGLRDSLGGTWAHDTEAIAVLGGPPPPAESPSADPAFVPSQPATQSNRLVPSENRQGLWLLMREYPGAAIVTAVVGGMVLVLGTFVGTQVYVQQQNLTYALREQEQQLLKDLVGQYSQSAPDERRGAIMALGSIRGDRSDIVLLVNLLGQEEDPKLVEALQQALSAAGPEALGYLANLNRTLKTDLDSLSVGNNTPEQLAARRRFRASQRALTKLLRLGPRSLETGGDQDPGSEKIDLSKVDFSQSNHPQLPFRLALGGADLSGLNLRSVLLTGAELRGSRFRNVGNDDQLDTYDDWVTDLSGAGLSEADLTGAFLSGVPLRRTNLGRATVNRADFSGGDLEGANFSGAQGVSAIFERSQLFQASFTGANFGKGNFQNANLQGVKGTRFQGQDAVFTGANLRQSTWRDANLSRSQLDRADLTQIDLSQTNLEGATFKSAWLQEANLTGANLTGADLTGAQLSGANFQNVTLFPANPNGSSGFVEKAPTGTSAQVRGVDFSQVKNLDSQQLTYLCTQGAIHQSCGS
ncbi:MAG: pentapeptide repeat-containing protein [Cyanophyceae cyanobacterium]